MRIVELGTAVEHGCAVTRGLHGGRDRSERVDERDGTGQGEQCGWSDGVHVDIIVIDAVLRIATILFRIATILRRT